MIDRSDWPYLEAENQGELLAYLGTATCAKSHQGADITWVMTGVESNDYNGVVWSRLTATEADHRVPALVQQFRERKLPALWHIDSASRPIDLEERLERLGCYRLRMGVCMAAPLSTISYPAPSIPELTFKRVTTTADLAAWMTVWTEDEEDPTARANVYTSLGFRASQPLRHYLAYLAEQPVGVAQLFLGQRAAGVYSVVVSPPFRGCGIGTALVRAVLRDARDACYEVAVLGPTPQAQPMYQRIGFELFPSPFVGYALWLDP